MQKFAAFCYLFRSFLFVHTAKSLQRVSGNEQTRNVDTARPDLEKLSLMWMRSFFNMRSLSTEMSRVCLLLHRVLRVLLYQYVRGNENVGRVRMGGDAFRQMSTVVEITQPVYHDRLFMSAFFTCTKHLLTLLVVICSVCIRYLRTALFCSIIFILHVFSVNEVHDVKHLILNPLSPAHTYTSTRMLRTGVRGCVRCQR